MARGKTGAPVKAPVPFTQVAPALRLTIISPYKLPAYKCPGFTAFTARALVGPVVSLVHDDPLSVLLNTPPVVKSPVAA